MPALRSRSIDSCAYMSSVRLSLKLNCHVQQSGGY